MAEFFDAVLAEMREYSTVTGSLINKWASRLQSAHEAEVGEWKARADTAVVLLQFLRSRFEKHMDASDKAVIDAFLSEQTGERENGDG